MPFPLTSCQEEPPLRTHSSQRQGAGRIKCQLVLVCFLWASAEPCVQRMLRAILSTGVETLVGRCLGWRREKDGEGERQHVDWACAWTLHMCYASQQGLGPTVWWGGREIQPQVQPHSSLLLRRLWNLQS